MAGHNLVLAPLYMSWLLLKVGIVRARERRRISNNDGSFLLHLSTLFGFVSQPAACALRRRACAADAERSLLESLSLLDSNCGEGVGDTAESFGDVVHRVMVFGVKSVGARSKCLLCFFTDCHKAARELDLPCPNPRVLQLVIDCLCCGRRADAGAVAVLAICDHEQLKRVHIKRF